MKIFVNLRCQLYWGSVVSGYMCDSLRVTDISGVSCLADCNQDRWDHAHSHPSLEPNFYVVFLCFRLVVCTMYDVSVGTREQHPSSRILSSEQHCTMGMDVENSDHCTVDNVVVPSCENKLWCIILYLASCMKQLQSLFSIEKSSMSYFHTFKFSRWEFKYQSRK